MEKWGDYFNLQLSTNMPLILYPIILIVAVIIFYILGKKNGTEKEVIKTVTISADEEVYTYYDETEEQYLVRCGRQYNSDSKTVKAPVKSDYLYSVLIKGSGRIYSSIEDNDLNKVAYHIYTNFIKELDTIDIYIRDNKYNEFMHIDKTNKSESMIGVDHPIHGHIGYLPFIRVNKI